MQERDAGAERRQMGDAAQIHHFLDIGSSQQGKSGGPARHNVLMVTENGEGMGSDGPGTHVKTQGSSSPAILYILGIINSKPCEAVNVVVKAPTAKEP